MGDVHKPDHQRSVVQPCSKWESSHQSPSRFAMDNVEFMVKLQCLLEELYGMILNFTSLSTEDADYTYRRKERHGSAVRREKQRYPGFLDSWFSYTINLASNFSVGVPEITEDQFFEDFSCINQIQAKKRGQINKEVCHIVSHGLLEYFCSTVKMLIQFILTHA